MAIYSLGAVHKTNEKRDMDRFLPQKSATRSASATLLANKNSKRRNCLLKDSAR